MEIRFVMQTYQNTEDQMNITIRAFLNIEQDKLMAEFTQNLMLK